MATSTDLRAAIEEVQEQLPADQTYAEDFADYEASWSTRLEQRVGALPWWVISAVVHAVIFLLATLLTVAVPSAHLDEVTIHTDVTKEKPPEFDRTKKRDIFRKTTEIQHETEVEKPVLVHEKAEISDHFETDNDMESQTAAGSQDAISDIPLGGTGTSGSIGVGGGGMAGCFGYRGGGGRKRAVARFGGSKATESAVDAALRWLARHQEPDGRWEALKWGGLKTAGGSYKKRCNISMTAFALLAFLGAGQTANAGQFRDNVRRAQKWLLKAQKDGGARWKEAGRFDRCLYTQGIATLALAEAYGMTKTPELGKAAQQAIDVVLKSQGPYEAWNYTAKSAAGRNDTSVTGWSLMALKSARIAGLKVDGAGFQGCMRWLDAATSLKTGRCSYSGRMADARKGGGSLAMCAAGMLMRQFMGVQRDAEVLKASARTIDKHQIEWKAGGKDTGVNFYYWYYATLCQFQIGGQHWKTWNTNMKKVLLANQRKGGPVDGSENDVDGSWDWEPCYFGKRCGRVYTTAMAALCLEVYYRYLPMYGK
jgi:hypothetical protein